MIELQQEKKSEKHREYILLYRKDKRCNWRRNRLIFRKQYDIWNFTPTGSWFHLNRECILVVESILRGLDS